MRLRRILYLALAAFLILYLFNNVFREPSLSTLVTIGVDDIISDFADLTDNPELPATINGSEKYLYVPKDFTGVSGQVFYLVIDDIYQYKIESGEDKEKLNYNLKNTFNNIRLPEDRFNIYEIKK